MISRPFQLDRTGDWSGRGSEVQPVVRPVIRWALYAFIFSLPFETLGIGADDAVSVTRIVGAVFLLTTLLQPRACYRLRPIALWWFAAFIVVYGVLGVYQAPAYQPEIIERLTTLVQLAVMFWACSNLLRDQTLAAGMLRSLVACYAAITVLQLTGLGASTYSEPGRVSALGQNANRLAGSLAFGILALLGLCYVRRTNSYRFRIYAWPLFALLIAGVIQTGSRGGLLALGVGLAALALGQPKMVGKLRAAAVMVLCLAVLVGLSLQSTLAMERWEKAIEYGNMAKREFLYPAAWGMVLERPVFGWGPVANRYELGYRTRLAGWHNHWQPWRDTHNLPLYALTATGLTGAIPLFVGIGFCLVAAWRGRTGPWGSLPVAMAVTLLMVNQSGTLLYYKLHWIVLAFCLASQFHLEPRETATPSEGSPAPSDVVHRPL